MRAPWRRLQALDPDKTYVATVTDIPPRKLSSTRAWFRGADEAKRQLLGTDGVVAFTIAASPLRKRYRTLSVWTDIDAIEQFARSHAHGRLVRELGPQLAPSRSVRWTFEGRDGLPSWREGMRRIENQAPDPISHPRSTP